MEIEIKLKIKDVEIILTDKEFIELRERLNSLFITYNYTIPSVGNGTTIPYYPSPYITCDTKL